MCVGYVVGEGDELKEQNVFTEEEEAGEKKSVCTQMHAQTRTYALTHQCIILSDLHTDWWRNRIRLQTPLHCTKKKKKKKKKFFLTSQSQQTAQSHYNSSERKRMLFSAHVREEQKVPVIGFLTVRTCMLP